MIENFKNIFIAIAFTFSLLITGCSSTDTEAVHEQEMDSQGAESSAPAAAEERLYRERDEAKESLEKEETEKLKKRKSSDDDMERLD